MKFFPPLQEERRIHQEIELQTYLNRLILEDKDRKAEELRKTGEDVDVLVSSGCSNLAFLRKGQAWATLPYQWNPIWEHEFLCREGGREGEKTTTF